MDGWMDSPGRHNDNQHCWFRKERAQNLNVAAGVVAWEGKRGHYPCFFFFFFVPTVVVLCTGFSLPDSGKDQGDFGHHLGQNMCTLGSDMASFACFQCRHASCTLTTQYEAVAACGSKSTDLLTAAVLCRDLSHPVWSFAPFERWRSPTESGKIIWVWNSGLVKVWKVMQFYSGCKNEIMFVKTDARLYKSHSCSCTTILAQTLCMCNHKSCLDLFSAKHTDGFP